MIIFNESLNYFNRLYFILFVLEVAVFVRLWFELIACRDI